MDIEALVNLTARAWSLDILAHLNRGVPGRQAPLIAATGAGRTAFGDSLAHLMALGLLERNPGHGHPLRPEFRLTSEGVRLAAMADQVLATAEESGSMALLRKRWTLPVLSVTRKPRRFSEVRQALRPVTDRALSQSLVRLEDVAWIRRDVDLSSRPMRPRYATIGTGAAISASIGAH